MRVKRAYVFSDFKITPRDTTENEIFPKLIGFFKGKPVVEVDFIDNPENRNIILHASSEVKIDRKEKAKGLINVLGFWGGKGRKMHCPFHDIPGVSPTVDPNFIEDFISAGIDSMKEYLEKGDYYSLFVASEAIKKLINFLSTSAEYGVSSEVIPAGGPTIYEFSPEVIASKFAEDFSKFEYELEKKADGKLFKFNSIKHIPIEEVIKVARKYEFAYPFLKGVFDNFLEDYKVLFNKDNAYEVYFTKKGNILDVKQVKTAGSDTTVYVYRFNKNELKKDILSRLASILKEAYIRRTPGAKNSKGEKAEWCIYSHKTGKRISCHKTKKDAEKHLQRMEYYKRKKKGSVYVVAFGKNPVFVTFDRDEALTVKDRLVNFANLVSYFNFYAMKNHSYKDLSEMAYAIHSASLLYKADIINLTLKDESVENFTEFVNEVIDYIDSLGVSYRYSFTFVNQAPRSTIPLSAEDAAKLNSRLDEVLQENGFVQNTASEGFIVYTKASNVSKNTKTDLNIEEVRDKLKEFIEKYDISDEAKFPPQIFSISVELDFGDKKILMNNKDAFIQGGEQND